MPEASTPSETNLCVFDGGLCVQEYNASALDPSEISYLSSEMLLTEYIRGEGLGGGVGGMVYSIRPQTANPQLQTIICSHSNPRGDLLARTDGNGSLTWYAVYEAYGTRPFEWSDGTTGNPDRQMANTKDEEAELGLLNEGMRYRDLETGTFLTRDPIRYADGPNMYCYVHCNPITHFDAWGLNMGFCVPPIHPGAIKAMQQQRQIEHELTKGIVDGLVEVATGKEAPAPRTETELAGRGYGRATGEFAGKTMEYAGAIEVAVGVFTQAGGKGMEGAGLMFAVPSGGGSLSVSAVGVAVDATGVALTVGGAVTAGVGIGLVENANGLPPLRMEMRSGGGKNGQHSNQNRRDKAGEQYEQLKAEYEKMKSQPNKTKEFKKEMLKTQKAMDRAKQKKDDTGENHSQKAKGS